MNFLAPAMLFGGLAVSIPIILHFFYKARHRKLPWAAMEFLRKSMEQTSKRLRFQEWVLLALRCLALLLLALALARPTMSSVSTGSRGESVDAIMLFDLSASMGARDGDKTRLQRAQEAALNVLDNLPPNSTIQLYAVTDRATALGPVSPRNIDQARQIVSGLSVTGMATDFLPAFSEALGALDRTVGSQKEVYLFSDMQKAGWERQMGAVRAKAEELKQRSTLLLVRCGDPARTLRTATLSDITYPGGLPHTGARLPFTLLLRNNGRDVLRDLTVTLEVDGKAAQKEAEAVPEIAPGSTVPVTLTAKLDEAGPRVLTARITSDDLPGDNRLDRIVPVRDMIRVLIVDGSPDLRDPRESGSHFIRNSLVPVSVSQLDDYYVKVQVVPAEEAGSGLLGNCDVCILANVPSTAADRPGIPGLTPDFIERLGRFVKDGGGLLIGLGDNITADRYNLALGKRGADLLPFELTAMKTTPANNPFKLAPDSVPASSYLARFRDEPYSTVTADADLITTFGFVEDGDRGRVLMRLADQTPVLASRTIGEGEVIVVGPGLDARWSNWPAKAGSYLSFMQMTLAHLASRNATRQTVVAGTPLVWHPPATSAKGFDLIPPTGPRVRLAPPAVDPATKKLTLSHGETGQAGVYQIVPVGDSAGPRFAVIPDLSEFDDLSTLGDREIQDSLGFSPVFLQAGSGAEQTIKTERSRREGTIWILLVLFGVAVVEMIWAWFCGKAW